MRVKDAVQLGGGPCYFRRGAGGFWCLRRFAGAKDIGLVAAQLGRIQVMLHWTRNAARGEIEGVVEGAKWRAGGRTRRVILLDVAIAIGDEMLLLDGSTATAMEPPSPIVFSNASSSLNFYTFSPLLSTYTLPCGSTARP